MRIGLAMAQYGAFASVGSVKRIAREAESLGYQSVWVGDRAMVPVAPKDLYPSFDGLIPEEHRRFLDPLAVLAGVALVTERVRLGTSTLNAPWYPPLLLARSLATIDQLSDGRLDAGFGLGWSTEEYAAVGVPWLERAGRLEETLDVLEEVWTRDPASHESSRWPIPPSYIQARPVQLPRPPIYLGGLTPTALERIGRRADGWLGVGMPLPHLLGLWSIARRSAERVGRDPDGLRLVLRVNATVTQAPASANMVPYRGTVDQITDYLRSAATAGVHEAFIDLQLGCTNDDQLLGLAQRLIRAL
ncbi:TIGR03619 family F420-dependent LLM class oxidoreductase [Actinoallomurus purpureus]|uniref:TIGR03619 family F420-dependent LLM class oxidoreductase n=1 Tax=Actinoallomurus purpureus TaxID=478114 RepID=UPI0020937BEA|nr:TIGR03619 family F420-dependent LLM class oxidoreductase [Actinoallomurus purpureus]MCO6010974.1 TIGR03619 family F420-dependent LLM class oxidoreductase [Actinoallomurus purpureus]